MWKTPLLLLFIPTNAKLPDRSRLTQTTANARQKQQQPINPLDNRYPIEGPSYRSKRINHDASTFSTSSSSTSSTSSAPWKMNVEETPQHNEQQYNDKKHNTKVQTDSMTIPRTLGYSSLSSQLTGCCYDYQNYAAEDMCALYGQDCQSGETPSHDSGDEDCSHDGLSFIGISFSVNTAMGNPYSYQLCDQLPMENIIDRSYDYIMSMDEDGWLVGGGYKNFDYSGKMPYIDSSHTELLRIGNLDPYSGGTSIEQVYAAMDSLTFPPFSIFPEYLKGGGGGHSGDNDNGGGMVPSGDVTLIVSVVETYEDGNSYSSYEQFLDDLFDAMDAVGGGPCMDDHDTDPHVSMARGVKFWSSTHYEQYMYNSNLEVAVWQAMYPHGVVIGSSGYAAFPPGSRSTKQYVGYGNLYFFFDRANITKAFPPNRELTDQETYYATLFKSSDVSDFYASTTTIGFDYSGSNDNDGQTYRHNPYNWRADMAIHDMTDGWDLPPNCLQEGETFFGIPLSRSSSSKLSGYADSFQDQFDFEYLVDRNNTYVSSFGTNHGWLIGEEIGNAVGSLVDKDTAHIPVFYAGTTNTNMGGMSLGDMIKIGKNIDFGRLYIKPAFVFVDQNGHLKLQFEADSSSALAYLYDSLCKGFGIAWNYKKPYNSYGIYTNCAMHAAGDRATYGCGPSNSNSGGFCPQMTLAYSPRFASEDHAAAYLARCNNYVDYWRSMYPSGVAVGTSAFCRDGGCLGLYLNRYDLYEVFKPDLGGSWVEFMVTDPPTISPAPTWKGGCSDPRNIHLSNCDPIAYNESLDWTEFGAIGQFAILLVGFMAAALSVSVFIARARRKKRRGESYVAFFFRDITRRRRKKKKNKRQKGYKTSRSSKVGNGDLEQSIIISDVGGDDGTAHSRKSKSSKRNGRSVSRGRKSTTSNNSKPSMPAQRRSKSRSRDGRSSSNKVNEDFGYHNLASNRQSDTDRHMKTNPRSRTRSRSGEGRLSSSRRSRSRKRRSNSKQREEDKRQQLV